MSDEKRDSGWANSAVVITVGQEEFGDSHVLAGMRFQRSLEKKAFLMGRGSVPVQSYFEFRTEYNSGPHDRAPANSGQAFEAPWAKGRCVKAPLHSLLPDRLTADFIEGMEEFGKKIEGFSGPEAVVAGIESRTSSPVRIPRGSTLESVGVKGLYPCGEGAGYAGGIMSAAMDGMRVAEAIAAKFAPFSSKEW